MEVESEGEDQQFISREERYVRSLDAAVIPPRGSSHLSLHLPKWSTSRSPRGASSHSPERHSHHSVNGVPLFRETVQITSLVPVT